MSDLAIHDARVHTMDAADTVLDRGCILIRDGLIASVSSGSMSGGSAPGGPECGCALAGAPILDAAGRTALPGFVDGHRHTWQTSFRQVFAGHAFGDYGAAMLAGLAPLFSPDDIYVGTLLGALTALDSGTTTIVDWAHAMNSPEHADASVQALHDSGIRAQLAYGIPRDGTGEWTGRSTREHPKDLARIHDRLGTHGRVRAAMAARGPEMSSPDTTRSDIEYARELGIRISMHVGAATLGPDMRAIERLHEWGLLGDDLTFIHLNSTSDDELSLLRDAGAGTCIGPATEILMPGVGWPPTGRLIAHGLRPALSIDTETATSGSMFDQFRAVLSAAAYGPGPRPTALDALRLGTVHGADAVGEGDRVGRIAAGLAGDVILIDTFAVNLAPAADPVASIVLSGHAGNVDTVVVDGRIVKQGGALGGHDVAAIGEHARASMAAIRSRGT